jgi:hypothetical protein
MKNVHVYTKYIFYFQGYYVRVTMSYFHNFDGEFLNK